MKSKLKYQNKILLLGCLFFLRFNTYGSIKNVPSIYTTIQTALNSCLNNDTVLVAPGTYYENLIWPTISNIKLISSGDSSNTIIDGGGNGRPLTIICPISNCIGTGTEINGFKFRNGYIQSTWAYGGGIYVQNANPTFKKIAVIGNHISSIDYCFGAGIYLKNSYCVIENSTISYNTIDTASWSYGGGVYVTEGAPTFNNVSIIGNMIHSDSWAGGSGFHCVNSNPSFTNGSVSENKSGNNASWYFGSLYISNCTSFNLTNIKVHGNKLGNNGSWYYSSGIYIRGSNATLTNILIDSNVNGTGGSWYFGLGIFVDRYANWYPANIINLIHVTVTNNINVTPNFIDGKSIYNDCYGNECDSLTINISNSILYNNTNGNEIYSLSPTNVVYSDIKRNIVYPGIGNINSNPNFVTVNNPYLNANSPCSNTGLILNYPTFDLNNSSRPYPIGSNPDMGCYENGLIYTYQNLYQTICQGDTFMNHFMTGIYIDTINTLTGYDTIRTLNLTVLPNSSSNLTQTI